MADEAIVASRATVEGEFLAPSSLKRLADLFYILNAPVELQGDQTTERAERAPSIAALSAPTPVMQPARQTFSGVRDAPLLWLSQLSASTPHTFFRIEFAVA
jgi:hypothetical protein